MRRLLERKTIWKATHILLFRHLRYNAKEHAKSFTVCSSKDGIWWCDCLVKICTHKLLVIRCETTWESAISLTNWSSRNRRLPEKRNTATDILKIRCDEVVLQNGITMQLTPCYGMRLPDRKKCSITYILLNEGWNGLRAEERTAYNVTHILCTCNDRYKQENNVTHILLVMRWDSMPKYLWWHLQSIVIR